MALAYFSTWTTYGTWLPGDERWWYERGAGLQAPDALRKLEAALRMTEDAVTLDRRQRRLVEQTVREHCTLRQWTLHAVNGRSNNVHVVVTAPDRPIEIPRDQFKAWCTRKLRQQAKVQHADWLRKNWWTQRGWDRYIDDEQDLQAVIAYVVEGQDR